MSLSFPIWTQEVGGRVHLRALVASSCGVQTQQLDRGTAARAANASTGAHLSPFLCFSLKEPPDRTPTALSSVPMVSLPRPPRVTQNPGVAEEDGGT